MSPRDAFARLATGSFVLVLALAACAEKTPPRPAEPPPAPSAAQPPAAPMSSAVAMIEPAPPRPASSVFPPLSPEERAAKMARVEALLAGGVAAGYDGPGNPRHVRLMLDDRDPWGGLEGAAMREVEVCRHRLLPAPPDEMTVNLVADAEGMLTGATIKGPASAKAFVTCAERALVGKKLRGKGSPQKGRLLFDEAAPKR